jgi:hypothetical protein
VGCLPDAVSLDGLLAESSRCRGNAHSVLKVCDGTFRYKIAAVVSFQPAYLELH